MLYKLFIDDERFPPISWCDQQAVIARSSQEAIECVSNLGMPQFISFDHDLGGDDTAIKFVKWLENSCVENKLLFPKDFEFYVHSQNHINIQYYMEALVKHFSE